MGKYWLLPGFEDLYLEDSWVLSIRPSESTLTLEVELVLRESHPLFRAPRPGEQYCYRRGRIRFEDVTELSWSGHGSSPATDVTGEQDLGSLDEFEVLGCAFTVGGDFGRIKVVSRQPTVEYVE